MLKNDDYTTGHLLDFSNHQNYYKLIGTDLSRQTNVGILQEIYFTGKLEEDHGVTTFFIAEKRQNNIVNFSLESLIVTKQYK